MFRHIVEAVIALNLGLCVGMAIERTRARARRAWPFNADWN